MDDAVLVTLLLELPQRTGMQHRQHDTLTPFPEPVVFPIEMTDLIVMVSNI